MASSEELGREWIVSVDDHIIEGPTTWTDRLPAKYHEAGPHIVNDELGQAWIYEGKRIGVMGLVVQGGQDPNTFTPAPVPYEEMNPACYDPAARVKAMDSDGVAASMPFPNLPRFCGQEFYEGKDKELSLLCVQAYNDHVLDDWVNAYPGRFMGAVILPLWDSKLAAREIHRCADKGAHSVVFSENPEPLGLPSIHDRGRYWDPIFQAAVDRKMPVAIHVGSSSTMPKTASDAPAIVPPVLMSWRAADTATDWVFSDNLSRFPDLKIILSEGGMGWLPFAIQRAEYGLRQYKSWVDRYTFNGDFSVTDRGEGYSSWTHGDKSVRDVYRDHIYGCFIDDRHGTESIDVIGADNVLAETDFPHADSTFPNSKQHMADALAHLSLEDELKVRHGNAMRLFNFEPALPQLV